MLGARPKLAIVPAAGMGTRLRPLTDSIPKEMLTIGRSPVIGHVIAEIASVGIPRVEVVLSPTKDLVRAYLGDGGRWGLSVGYALQPEMRGVGDALLTALDGDSDTILAAFGDCAMLRPPAVGGPAATQRLVDAHMAMHAHASVLCERVPRERTRHYGVLQPAPDGDTPGRKAFSVTGIVEKPDPAVAPSEWVVAARWVLTPDAVAYIRTQTPGPNGEVGVTEAIARLIADGGHVVAVPMMPWERRCDVGNWRSLLTAQALASVWDAEWGDDVRRMLAAMGDA